MRNMVWIASYPKSGNTWVRAFLSCLLYPEKDSNFINELIAPIAANRRILEEELCIETSELTFDELEELRPVALTYYSNNHGSEPVFWKVHDAYTYTKSGDPLFPPAVSKGVIYVARNPLDVVVSYGHHSNKSIDEMINTMADEGHAYNDKEDRITGQVLQKLLSWSSHVNSWVNQHDMPVLLIRYEDLKTDTLNTFKKIVDFSGLMYTDEEIKSAIDKTSFDNLQKQEVETGFKGRVSNSALFFREGKSGVWEKELTREQVDKIVNTHKDVMKSLGYF